MKFCVIGTGSGGRAFAAYLSSKDHDVNLYNRSYHRISKIRELGGIETTGELEGFFPINMATQNLWGAVNDVDVILITTPASAHKILARQLAPFLKTRQIVILNPGRTFGSVEFMQEVKKKRGYFPGFIGEAQTLLFTCRADNGNGVTILKIKEKVKFTTYPEKYIDLVHSIIKDVFPEFDPIDNYLEVTLNNIGMLVHPAISLFNAANMDNAREFNFYCDGASRRVCQVLESLEKEINEIFERFGLKQYRFHRWAQDTYGVRSKSIFSALNNIEPYKTIIAPAELVTRYFTEDVPTGLVAVASLAEYLNIETPTINSIIHLSSILCGQDFYKTGRRVENLNISDYIEESLIELEHPLVRELSIEEDTKTTKDEDL